MKILKLLIFISINALTAEVSTSPFIISEQECEGVVISENVYFKGNSKITHPANMFRSISPVFIINEQTKIQIWSGNGGASECTMGWYRASNYSPGNQTEVNSFYNNDCNLTRNNNPRLPFAQIAYQVAYKNQLNILDEIKPNQYFYFKPQSPEPIYIEDQRTREWGSVEHAPKACLNYYARWCGDGIVDKENNESCDLGEQNGKNSTCSTACQTIIKEK